MADRSSRLRQKIRQTQQRYLALLDGLVDERGPLIRGSFGTRARLCGVATCRCTQGYRHESKYLSASEGGRVRQVHVPVHEEAEVLAGVARYRRFWRDRARMAKLGELQLELVDDLGRSLLGAYPMANPLPAPKRRGRTPKDPRRGPR